MSTPMSLEEQLEKAKNDLEDANQTIALQQIELDAKDQELTEMQEALAETYDRLSSYDDDLDFELQSRLAEMEEELDRVWALRMISETEKLRRERDKYEQIALQSATSLRESNATWSKCFTAVLASKITGNDIPSDLLRPVLLHPFSSMEQFSWSVVTSYVFAEAYTGPDISQVTRDDLKMVELLCWIKDISVPSDMPDDGLSQIVWLEANLLEKIRTEHRRGTWVLLAYSLLSKMVTSRDWPACCIAAVRLAILGRKYPLYDKAVWDAFVADLMNQYAQLDVDPLGQACLAYLCLTTRDPSAMMAQNLPEALSQATFDTSMRIPEFLAKLEDQAVAVSHDRGSLSVVFIRRHHQTAVFSRIRDSTQWSFSTQPLELSNPAIGIRRITWGSRPEQSFDDATGQSSLWLYVCRNYPILVIELKQEINRKTEVMVAEITRRLDE